MSVDIFRGFFQKETTLFPFFFNSFFLKGHLTASPSANDCGQTFYSEHDLRCDSLVNFHKVDWDAIREKRKKKNYN